MSPTASFAYIICLLRRYCSTSSAHIRKHFHTHIIINRFEKVSNFSITITQHDRFPIKLRTLLNWMCLWKTFKIFFTLYRTQLLFFTFSIKKSQSQNEVPNTKIKHLSHSYTFLSCNYWQYKNLHCRRFQPNPFKVFEPCFKFASET